MNKEPLDPRLEAYLALCQRIFERMRREGDWPWADDAEPDGDGEPLDT